MLQYELVTCDLNTNSRYIFSSIIQITVTFSSIKVSVTFYLGTNSSYVRLRYNLQKLRFVYKFQSCITSALNLNKTCSQFSLNFFFHRNLYRYFQRDSTISFSKITSNALKRKSKFPSASAIKKNIFSCVYRFVKYDFRCFLNIQNSSIMRRLFIYRIYQEYGPENNLAVGRIRFVHLTSFTSNIDTNVLLDVIYTVHPVFVQPVFVQLFSSNPFRPIL